METPVTQVHVLRLRIEHRPAGESGIIGVFSTWDKASDFGKDNYRPLADGLVVWCIESFELDKV